jgi:hypothetical protein
VDEFIVRAGDDIFDASGEDCDVEVKVDVPWWDWGALDDDPPPWDWEEDESRKIDICCSRGFSIIFSVYLREVEKMLKEINPTMAIWRV